MTENRTSDLGNDLPRTLGELRAQLAEAASASKGLLEAVHPDQRNSACNLIHYLAFRRDDRSPLQEALSSRGLSSLARVEAHVMASLDAVLTAVHGLENRSEHACPSAPVNPAQAQQLLKDHAEALLGKGRTDGAVRVMVTVPSEAARDYGLVRDLVAAGMDCMRINCAHDGPEQWAAMAENLRKAERELGAACSIHMDLAGLKLRTGKVRPRAAVLKVRPCRDERGRVTQPARVWLHAEGAEPNAAASGLACLPVPAAWLRRLWVGHVIRFEDARGAKRRLQVTEVTPDGCVAALAQTAYFEPGQALWNGGSKGRRKGAPCARVGNLPRGEGFLQLRPGDTLVLRVTPDEGTPAILDAQGRVVKPAEIGCEPPGVLGAVSVGDRVWLDDGQIGGTVQAAAENRLEVLITEGRARGRKLRGEKGVNFPDSPIRLPALTGQDRQDLAVVVRHADSVGLSFARTVQDVLDLQESLRQAGDRQPGIILKVETKEAFQQLPRLLLTAMRSPKVGVMIARGDLAVECGYERLAEAQEEILWVCAAAHVPAVWATQVLDRLAKDGIPSRAEISDAVLAQRAECVMLNKGPFILSAIKVLQDILARMGGHQHKTRARLRALQLARDFQA